MIILYKCDKIPRLTHIPSCVYATDYQHWKNKCQKCQIAVCEVLIAVCEVLIAVCEVLIAVCEILIAVCEVLIAVCEVLIAVCEILIAVCEVLIAVCEVLIAVYEVLIVSSTKALLKASGFRPLSFCAPFHFTPLLHLRPIIFRCNDLWQVQTFGNKVNKSKFYSGRN